MAKRVGRKSEILEAAGGLFARKGVAGTTVRDIGEAAGVFPGSIYYHFDSKDAIVDEILMGFYGHAMEDYRRVAEETEDPEEALEALIRMAYLVVGDYPHAIAIIQGDTGYLSRSDRFRYVQESGTEVKSIFVSVIRRGVEQGRLAPDTDPDLVYRFVRDAVWATVRWYDADGQYSLEELARTYSRTLMHGIAAGREP